MNTNSDKFFADAIEKFQKYPRKYPVPELQPPFPIEINSFHFTKEKDIDKWLNWWKEIAHTVGQQVQQMRELAIFPALLYPRCKELARYEHLVKLIMILFVIDDVSDSIPGQTKLTTGQFNEQLNRLLDKLVAKEYLPLTGLKPYNLGLYAVLESIVFQLNDQQKRRLVRTCKDYAQGCFWKQRAIGNNEQMEQSESIRLRALGARLAIQLVEYSEDIALTDNEFNDPRIQRLIDSIAMNMCYSFDLHSAEKEMEENPDHPETTFNVLALIHVLNKCSVKEAMDEVVVKLNDSFQVINELIDDIKADPTTSEALKEFAYKSALLASGHYRAVTIVKRYNGPQDQ